MNSNFITSAPLIGSYKNGNYTVQIYADGTKVRENDLDNFDAAFPENFDIKITNMCNNSCKFCFECSAPNGKHGDIMAPSFLDKLHPFTEISIGGGDPLTHPDLIRFLIKLKKQKVIPSITVRQNNFMENLALMRFLRDEKLIYGIGVSLVDPNQNGFIEAVKEFPSAVIHVINGIVTMPQLDALARNDLKILILGYKDFRKGLEYHQSDSNIDGLKDDLYIYLPMIVKEGWFDVVSFDNRAIKQLNPKRFLSDEKWNEIYMGDDGIDGEMTSASMYIDMVERKFAKNSCDPTRNDILCNIDQMYQALKKG